MLPVRGGEALRGALGFLFPFNYSELSQASFRHPGPSQSADIGSQLLNQGVTIIGGRGELVDGTSPDGAPELQCADDCEQAGQRRGYRIDDGIPVLLENEARALSLDEKHA